MLKHPLSNDTRKALRVHLGDEAGTALADVILHIMARIEELERNKVSVTHIVQTQDKRPAGTSRSYVNESGRP